MLTGWTPTPYHLYSPSQPGGEGISDLLLTFEEPEASRHIAEPAAVRGARDLGSARKKLPAFSGVRPLTPDVPLTSILKSHGVLPL